MRPWQKESGWRLGAKLAVERPGPNWKGGGLVLGWAVAALRPSVVAEGEADGLADPIAEIIRRYREESAARPDCDGVTLYRYGSENSFSRSKAAEQGDTHEQHNALIDAAKIRLEEAGIPVIVEIVK